ncbi:MAG TPA: nitroreductase family protein [Bacteroidales bacterium]|nr:nitroreductase family protein [Bacteroidales bacterium]
MPVNDLILQRRSALAFSSEPLDAETLASLFEAARWAPSSSNLQPWLFLYAQSQQTDLFQAILSALNEGNQIWAKDASLLIVTLARTVTEEKNTPNPYAWHDCGLALQNLLLQATYLGLAAHPMGGFDPKKLIDNLHIPPFYQPVTVSAIGWPGNPDQLPEYLHKRLSSPRTRKDTADIVRNTFF